MFGGRERRELEARVARLEAKLESVQERLEARVDELTRDKEGDPEARLRFLMNHVAGELGQQLERAVADLRAGREALPALEELRTALETAAAGIAAPRLRASLDKIYRAERTGYVSLYFDGGYTDRVKLLVGPEDPPDSVICELNTSNSINSYAGGVVRRGEYWMARSEKPTKSGVKCVFTPFL
jgi:hypothetical protein